MARPDPDCPMCGGSGHVLDTTYIVPTSGRRCDCLAAAMVAEATGARLDAVNLPPEYAEAEIDTFEVRPEPVNPKTGEAIDTENIASARELASSPLADGRTVFFTGPSGTGKTYLAAALLRAQVIAHGASGMYMSAYAYLRSLQPEMLTPSEQRAVREAAKNVDILLIDDLGTEKGSEFSRRELFDLFDTRLNHQRATIITSNYTMSALFSGEDAINAERIKSRLRQNLVGLAWPKDMADYRPEVGRRRAAESRARAESAYRAERDAREDGFTAQAADEFDFGSAIGPEKRRRRSKTP